MTGSPGIRYEEEEEEVDCDDREDEEEMEVDCDDRGEEVDEEDVEEPQSTVLLLLSAVVAS